MSEKSGDQISRNPLRVILKGVQRYIKRSTDKPPNTVVYSSGGGSTGSDEYMTNPMTNTGDIIFGSTIGIPSTPARLGIGTLGQVYTVGVGGTGIWADIGGALVSAETNCPLGTTVIDMGAISDDAIDYDVFVKIKTISGISHAQSRPRAVQLGGIGFEWYKDSGNLKIHIENDSNGSVTAIVSARKI